jgi:hypothetical protein
MDQLMKFGKNMIKKKTGGDSSDSGSGGGGFGNPMAMLKQFDRDGDGNITENDFVLAVNQMGLGSVGETAVRAAFKRIDKNKNGKLDMSEALGLVEVVKDLFKSKSSA